MGAPDANNYARGNAYDTGVDAEISRWLDVKGSKVAATRAKYSRIINRWRLSLRELSIADANMLHVERYIASRLNDEGRKSNTGGSTKLAGRTIRCERAILSSLYAMLQHAGHVRANPWALVPCPVGVTYRQKHVADAVPFDKIQALLHYPSAYTFQGKRDRCWLALLFYGALRIGEVLAARIEDFRDAGDGRLLIRLRETKSGADPVTIMQAAATPLIRPYLEAASPFGKLFYSRPQSLRVRLKRFCRELGIEGQITPHSARTTVADKIIADGGNIFDVKDMLHHASISTSEIYVRRQNEKRNPAGEKFRY